MTSQTADELAPPRHVRVRVLPRSGSDALWPVMLPLALMLASDYKLRARANNQAISGHADATVLLEIAVYGLAALYMYWRFGLRAPRRRGSPLLLIAWAWAAFLALSTIWSPYPQLGTVRGAQLLITAAVGYVLATRASPADLHRFAHAFVVVVLASVVIGVAHPFPREPWALHRFNWLYVPVVTAGVYLGIAIVIVVGFMMRREGRRWRRWVYFVALAVLATALVATGTRGAAVGAMAGLLVLLATMNGPRGRADLIVLGVVIGVIAVLAFSDKLLAFATRGENTQQLLTLNNRTGLWSLAFQAFERDPLFGHGLGASRGLFLSTIGLGGGHNVFVNALVDDGIVGAVLFAAVLSMLAMTLIRLMRLRGVRTDTALLLGLLTFSVADGMTQEGLAAPANVSSVWLFILIAWTESLRREAAN